MVMGLLTGIFILVFGIILIPILPTNPFYYFIVFVGLTMTITFTVLLIKRHNRLKEEQNWILKSELFDGSFVNPFEKSKTVSKILAEAKEMAQSKGLTTFYKKNEQWLEHDVKLFFDDPKYSNALAVYYVYGIYNEARATFCHRKHIDRKKFYSPSVLMDDEYRELYTEFIKNYQTPIISLILEFPQKNMGIEKYCSFIWDLFLSQNDDEFLSIIETYGVEVSERLKKYLNNDIDVLIETLYFSIIYSVEKATNSYDGWNKYSKLNFVVYYFSVCYESVKDVGEEADVLDFQSKFKTIFVKNAVESYKFDDFEATSFFEKRFDVYKEILSEFSVNSIDDAIDETKKYLISQKHGDYTENDFGIVTEISTVHLSISQQARPYIDKICEEYSKG
ncbi:MAG: hypothetical protein IJ309_06345 [Clostridia bacterium]|nr:hypothetical protein [Clostridia bacterium]